MAKSMSIKLEFVAPLPQIAITRFTYNAVEFYGIMLVLKFVGIQN